MSRCESVRRGLVHSSSGDSVTPVNYTSSRTSSFAELLAEVSVFREKIIRYIKLGSFFYFQIEPGTGIGWELDKVDEECDWTGGRFVRVRAIIRNDARYLRVKYLELVIFVLEVPYRTSSIYR